MSAVAAAVMGCLSFVITRASERRSSIESAAVT
jgi:hypothetical protein